MGTGAFTRAEASTSGCKDTTIEEYQDRWYSRMRIYMVFEAGSIHRREKVVGSSPVGHTSGVGRLPRRACLAGRARTLRLEGGHCSRMRILLYVRMVIRTRAEVGRGAFYNWGRGMGPALCGWLRHGGVRRCRFNLGQTEDNFSHCDVQLGSFSWTKLYLTIFSELGACLSLGSAAGFLPC